MSGIKRLTWRFWRWLRPHWIWTIVMVLIIVLVPLGIWIAGKGGPWFQSLEAINILWILVPGSLIGFWRWIRSREQGEDPFERCTSAAAARESLLPEDELEGLGIRISHLSRRTNEIDEVLTRRPTAQRRNVLVVGSDYSGKTRELVEVAGRHILGGSEALVYVSGAPSGRIRPNLRGLRRRVLVFVDDIHDLCRQEHRVTERGLTDVLGGFVRKELKRRLRRDVSVVASCAFYPKALDDIEWGMHWFWEDFELIPVGFLSDAELEQVVEELAGETSLAVDEPYRRFIIDNNTGVFVPVLELFNRVAESSKLEEGDFSWYRGKLRDYWNAARDRLTEEIPGSDAIFQAVDILQQLGVDLWEDLVLDVALATSGHRAEKLGWAVEQMKRFALPPSERPGYLCVFSGQADVGYSPKDEAESGAIAGALVKHGAAIGPEVLFDAALELVHSYGQVSAAIDLWYSVVGASALSAVARFNIGVAARRMGDETQGAMHLAESITDCPELAVRFVRGEGFLSRSEMRFLGKMHRGTVTDGVKNAACELCDCIIERAEDVQMYRETLLRLSAKGSEYAPKDVRVCFNRCRVLDVLKMHPEVIDELESLGQILVNSSSLSSASLLWEAAVMRHKWVEQTAQRRLDARLKDKRYESVTELMNARRELQLVVARLRSEQAKENHLRAVENRKQAGVDPEDLPSIEPPQVKWFLERKREVEAKVRATERSLTESLRLALRSDVLQLENREFEQTLYWAERAREIDPAVGNPKFIDHLRTILGKGE